jgi:hypothetical protein
MFQDAVGHSKLARRAREISTCVALGLGVYVVCMFWKRRKYAPPSVGFWFVILVISIVVTLPLSAPLWEVLPMLQNVQFPWRFGVVTTLATAALIAVALSELRWEPGSTRKVFGRGWGVFYLAIAIAVFIGLSLVVIALVPDWHLSVILSAFSASICIFVGLKRTTAPDMTRHAFGLGLSILFLLATNVPYVLLGLDIRRHAAKEQNLYKVEHRELSIDAPEYRISHIERFNPAEIRRLSVRSKHATVDSGSGIVKILDSKPRSIRFSVHADSPLTVTFSRYYYPGTEFMYLNGDDVGKAYPAPENGLVRVRIPSGSYTMKLVLTAGKMERIGIFVSIFSAVVVISILAFSISLKIFPPFRVQQSVLNNPHP